MKRVWLKRSIWGVIILLAVVAAVVAVGFINLNGLTRRIIVRSLEKQTGTGVRLEAAEIGVRDGSFQLRGLVISNPPGFGPGPLVSIPELYLRYDPAAASSNIFRLAEARFHLEEVNVAVDREGRTNLMELGREMAMDSGQSLTNLLRGMHFGGIDRLTLTLRKVAMSDERQPKANVIYDLGITNLTFTNVTSGTQVLLPLLLEIGLRTQLRWP